MIRMILEMARRPEVLIDHCLAFFYFASLHAEGFELQISTSVVLSALYCACWIRLSFTSNIRVPVVPPFQIANIAVCCP